MHEHEITLTRRTVVAPAPGITGVVPDRKAAFGLPGDRLRVHDMEVRSGVPWFRATLLRADAGDYDGYVIHAALMGQAGAGDVLRRFCG